MKRPPLVMYGVMVLSLLPIITWEMACANYHVVNDIVGWPMFARLKSRVRSINSYQQILTILSLQKILLVPLVLHITTGRLKINCPMWLFVSCVAALYMIALLAIYLSTPYSLHWHLMNSADRTIQPIGLMLGYYALLQLNIRYAKQRPTG